MAREHAGVADGEVDLPEAAVVAVDRLAVAEAGRRGADGLAAGGQRVVELAQQLLDRARLLERLLGAVGVARVERARGALQRAAEPAEHGLRGAADRQHRVGREEQRDRRAPPRRRSRPRGSGSARTPRRRTGPVITSSIAETAASEITSSEPLSSTATDMASTTMIASCGAPVPMKWMITSATARPSTTPATSCSRALAVRAVRGADRDHRRDAGEDRLRVGQQQDAQVPGGQRGDRRLEDRDVRVFRRRRAVVMCISAVIRVT